MARQWIVNNRHAAADDRNEGTREAPLKTINAAAQRALPGDTVIVHEGVYRECVVPARGGTEDAPITYRAAEDEEVCIRGSELYEGAWEKLSGNVYAALLPKEKTAKYNPFALRRLDIFPSWHEQMGDVGHHHTLGQVYVDGNRLSGTDSLEEVMHRPNTFFSDREKVYVHFDGRVTDPARHEVEFTLRPSVFRPEKRGLGYIVIEGFILEHAANQSISKFWLADFAPQQGLVSCRSGHHWVIRNNVIRHATSIGIDVGSEGRAQELNGQPTPKVVGHHLITRNEITDNGQCGLCGLRHFGTRIIGNLFERNGNLGATAWEEGAIKTHFFVNGLIEGNIIRNNDCHGIWLDNVYQNVRVTRNVITGCRGAGIFCEMAGGPCLIDHNIIAHTLQGCGDIGGHGIYAHDAGGMTIVHNLFLENSRYGIYIQIVTDRKYQVLSGTDDLSLPPVDIKSCDAVDIIIHYNRFVNNSQGALFLPLDGPRAGNIRSDYNDLCKTTGDSLGLNHTGTFTNAESGATVTSGKGKTPPPEEHICLEDWRARTGNDAHTQLMTMKNQSWQMLHAGNEPFLVFSIDAVPVYPRVEIEGLDKDMEGAPLKPFAVPGPFARVDRPGNYRFDLPLYR